MSETIKLSKVYANQVPVLLDKTIDGKIIVKPKLFQLDVKKSRLKYGGSWKDENHVIENWVPDKSIIKELIFIGYDQRTIERLGDDADELPSMTIHLPYSDMYKPLADAVLKKRVQFIEIENLYGIAKMVGEQYKSLKLDYYATKVVASNGPVNNSQAQQQAKPQVQQQIKQ